MQRRDLIAHVSSQCALTMAQARVVVDCMADAILGQLLAGRTVTIRGLGGFHPRKNDKVNFKPAKLRQDSNPAE